MNIYLLNSYQVIINQNHTYGIEHQVTTNLCKIEILI